MTTAEEMKSIARRIAIDAFSQGDPTVIDELVADDFVDHDPAPGTEPTKAGLKASVSELRTAFPDLVYDVEEEIAEGDIVMQRVIGSGTFSGYSQSLGVQPNGRRATWQEIHIVRCADGKLVEHWGQVDQMSMLRQLGLMPGEQAA